MGEERGLNPLLELEKGTGPIPEKCVVGFTRKFVNSSTMERRVVWVTEGWSESHFKFLDRRWILRDLFGRRVT